MEKRRRARINNSLNDLKTLVLESMKKDVSIIFYLFHSIYFMKSVHIEIHKIKNYLFKFFKEINYF